MDQFLPTIILRHRKENLKKCSLRGLEKRSDIRFYSYPLAEEQPDLSAYVVLSMDGPPLTANDRDKGIFLIDGTWRYAEKMGRSIHGPNLVRSLPSVRTAYPRKQEDCPDPTRGLASVEALYLAYMILGRNTDGLLDHYYWKEEFLAIIEACQPA
ncbi:MAG: hypothetical protein KR126chlam1_00041 [Chlamydiae bacterium]|nr:hypothetical protein [Chlamydiota bacterium]